MADSIARYQKLVDDRLSGLLKSFSEYDFEFKPLFNLHDFERQLYPLIEPLMQQSVKDRYSKVFKLLYNIFVETCNSSVAKESKAQYDKFVTLIDICVCISKIQSADFADLPNDMLTNLIQFDMFDEVEDLIGQYGRMNYKFSTKLLISLRKKYISENPNPNRIRNKKKKKKSKSTARLLDELTEKLMSNPSSSDSKSLPFDKPEKGKNARCRTGNNSSDDDDDNDLDDDDDDDSSDHVMDTKASHRSTRGSTKKHDEPIQIDSESREDSHHDVDINEELSDYDSDANSDSEIEDSNHVHRTVLNLNRNKTRSLRGPTTKSKSKISKSQTVISNNDELKPSKKRKTMEKITKDKKRKTSTKTTTKPTFDRSKKGFHISHNRLDKKWSVAIEPNLNFLYSKVESKFQPTEPLISKPESNGFLYKPPQFTLFECMEETEDFKVDIYKAMDQLINTFLLQGYKKAGGIKYDPSMFLHPLEFTYIQSNMAKLRASSATKLPALLFGDRWQSLLKEEADAHSQSNLKSLKIKATKVKDIWLLKPFSTEEHYWEHFKKIVPRSQVSKRLEFLNTIIADADNNLYVCDDLERIFEFVDHNRELIEVSDDEDEEEEEVLNTPIETDQDVFENSKATELNDIQKSGDVSIDKEMDDNRKTRISSLRGVWVACKSIKKILPPKEQFKVLSNILFPSLKLQKDYKGVSSHTISDLFNVYSGLRPYLLEMFVDDIFEFNSMPMYFKLDSTMFELQMQAKFKNHTA